MSATDDSAANKLLVVSLYTPEEYYKASARLLKQDCDGLGVASDIVELPSHGDWSKNINIKPRFYSNSMAKHNRPLLCMDVDARLLKIPARYMNKCDFDMAILPKGETSPRKWEECFIYANNTKMSRQFLERWATLTDRDKGNGICSGEYYLDRAWREMGHLMNIEHLPNEYLCIGEPTQDTVIKYIESPGNAAAMVKKKASKRVTAFWSETPRPGNLGDMLTPWMIQRETEKWPIRGGRDTLLCAGSILTWGLPGATVWGSGVVQMGEKISPDLKIIATRGPLSAKTVKENGYNLPTVHGDPGILLPYFYNKPMDKIYNLGIVPHYVDYKYAMAMFQEREDIKIINPLTNNLWATIDEITQCKKIASSSLHGLVVAAAYGIPSAWISFPNKKGRQICGDGTKFRDFYMSIKQDVPSSQKVKDAGDADRLNFVDAGSVLPLFDDLWECCPFRLDNL